MSNGYEADIDLTRQRLENPEGGVSTELSITIEADGEHINIPTIVRGERLSPEDAIAAWERGENPEVGRFESLEEAEAAAQARSQRIGELLEAGDTGAAAPTAFAAQPAAAPTAAAGAAPATDESFLRWQRTTGRAPPPAAPRTGRGAPPAPPPAEPVSWKVRREQSDYLNGSVEAQRKIQDAWYREWEEWGDKTYKKKSDRFDFRNTLYESVPRVQLPTRSVSDWWRDNTNELIQGSVGVGRAVGFVAEQFGMNPEQDPNSFLYVFTGKGANEAQEAALDVRGSERKKEVARIRAERLKAVEDKGIGEAVGAVVDFYKDYPEEVWFGTVGTVPLIAAVAVAGKAAAGAALRAVGPAVARGAMTTARAKQIVTGAGAIGAGVPYGGAFSAEVYDSTLQALREIPEERWRTDPIYQDTVKRNPGMSHNDVVDIVGRDRAFWPAVIIGTVAGAAEPFFGLTKSLVGPASKSLRDYLVKGIGPAAALAKVPAQAAAGATARVAKATLFEPSQEATEGVAKALAVNKAIAETAPELAKPSRIGQEAAEGFIVGLGPGAASGAMTVRTEMQEAALRAGAAGGAPGPAPGVPAGAPPGAAPGAAPGGPGAPPGPPGGPGAAPGAVPPPAGPGAPGAPAAGTAAPASPAERILAATTQVGEEAFVKGYQERVKALGPDATETQQEAALTAYVDEVLGVSPAGPRGAPPGGPGAAPTTAEPGDLDFTKPGAIPQAPAPEAAPAKPEAPGAALADRFQAGPEEGTRFRVNPNQRAVGGAVLYETRNDNVGSQAAYYVGKDGNLLPIERVVLNRPETKEALWIPSNDAARAEAADILRQMGPLKLKDPKREALKQRLKDLVTGKRAPAAPAAPKAAPSAPEAPTEPAAFKLSEPFRRIKPRYGYKDRNFEVAFDNDFDRATYTLSQSVKNKRHDEILNELLDTGYTEAQLIEHGKRVRARLKEWAQGKPEGDDAIRLPAVAPAQRLTAEARDRAEAAEADRKAERSQQATDRFKKDQIVDPAKDSLFTAIAKLGGLNRDSVVGEWGVDLDKPFKSKSLLPVVRAKAGGGLTIDGMGEALAPFGYIELDENGKHDLRDFEEKFDLESRGQLQYTPLGEEALAREAGDAEAQARQRAEDAEADARAAVVQEAELTPEEIVATGYYDLNSDEQRAAEALVLSLRERFAGTEAEAKIDEIIERAAIAAESDPDPAAFRRAVIAGIREEVGREAAAEQPPPGEREPARPGREEADEAAREPPEREAAPRAAAPGAEVAPLALEAATPEALRERAARPEGPTAREIADRERDVFRLTDETPTPPRTTGLQQGLPLPAPGAAAADEVAAAIQRVTTPAPPINFDTRLGERVKDAENTWRAAIDNASRSGVDLTLEEINAPFNVGPAARRALPGGPMSETREDAIRIARAEIKAFEEAAAKLNSEAQARGERDLGARMTREEAAADRLDALERAITPAANDLDADRQLSHDDSSPDDPLLFASGLSRATEFVPGLARNVNVGVQIGELSGRAIDTLADALTKSVANVFVDSGAFSVYQANEKAKKGAQLTIEEFGPGGESLDFDQIIDRMEQLQDAVAKADVDGATGAGYRQFYVMPDIVGQQAASLELAKQYADAIGNFRNPIVPIQVGELSLADAYAKLLENTGRDGGLIVGIPSNEAAAPASQVVDLVRQHGDKIAGIHFLGAVDKATLGPKLDAVKAAGWDGPTSADANVLRANLYAGPRAEALRTALAGVGEGVAPPPGVRALAARRRDLTTDARVQGGVLLARQGGTDAEPRRILLTPRLDDSGGFRVTSFLGNEPMRHAEYDSIEDAVAEFMPENTELEPLPEGVGPTSARIQAMQEAKAEAEAELERRAKLTPPAKRNAKKRKDISDGIAQATENAKSEAERQPRRPRARKAAAPGGAAPERAGVELPPQAAEGEGAVEQRPTRGVKRPPGKRGGEVRYEIRGQPGGPFVSAPDVAKVEFKGQRATVTFKDGTTGVFNRSDVRRTKPGPLEEPSAFLTPRQQRQLDALDTLTSEVSPEREEHRKAAARSTVVDRAYEGMLRRKWNDLYGDLVRTNVEIRKQAAMYEAALHAGDQATADALEADLAVMVQVQVSRAQLLEWYGRQLYYSRLIRLDKSYKHSNEAQIRSTVADILGVRPEELGTRHVPGVHVVSEEAIDGHTVTVYDSRGQPVEISGVGAQAAAFYDQATNNIVFIAERTPLGQERGTFFHEVGHKRLEQMVGRDKLDRVRREVLGWENAPEGSLERKVYDKLARKLEAATLDRKGFRKEQVRAEEIVPYVISIGEEMGVEPSNKNLLAPGFRGVIARLWKWIRDGANKALRSMGLKGPEDVSLKVGDVMALAWGMARLEAGAKEFEALARGDVPAKGTPLAAELAAARELMGIPAFRDTVARLKRAERQFVPEAAGPETRGAEYRFIQTALGQEAKRRGMMEKYATARKDAIAQAAAAPAPVGPLNPQFSPIIFKQPRKQVAIRTREDLRDFAATGRRPEVAAIPTMKEWLVENITDNQRPFLRWLRENNLGRRAWEQLKLTTGRLRNQAEIYNREILEPLSKDIATFAKNAGIAYEQAALVTGWWSTLRHVPEANAALRDKLIRRIATGDRAAVTELRRFMETQAGLHPQLKDPERGSMAAGVTDAEAAQYTQQILAPYNAQQRQEIQAIGDKIVAAFARLKRDAIASGQISPQAAAQFPNFRHYVALTGDNTPIWDAVESSDAFGSYIAENRLRAREGRGGETVSESALEALAERIGRVASYKASVPFKRELNDIYNRAGGANNTIGLERISANLVQQPHHSDIVWTAPGGQRWIYRFSQSAGIGEALLGQNREEMNGLILKGIDSVTRRFSRAVTQWVLLFGPVNMFRDVYEKAKLIRSRGVEDQHGNVVSANRVWQLTWRNSMNPETWRTAFQLAFSPTKQASNATQIGRWSNELVEDGGISTWGETTRKGLETIKEGVEKEAKLAGYGSVREKWWENAKEWIARYNLMFEVVSSLSVNAAMRELGVERQKASAETLDLMNFANVGAKTKWARAMYSFFNPAVQSGYNVAKQLSTSRGKRDLLITLTVMGFIQGLMRMMGDDDPELGDKLDQIGTWESDRNLSIRLFGVDLKLPIGFGMGQLAWGLTNAFSRWLSGRYSAADALAQAGVSALKTVNPIPISEVPPTKQPVNFLVKTFWPTVARPLIDMATDTDAWGTKLTTYYPDKTKLRSEQGRAGTPQLYKDWSRDLAKVGFDVYPEHLRAAKEMFAWGPVGYAMDSWADSNKEAEGRRLNPIDKIPGSALLRITGASRFVGGGSRYLEARYYEKMDEVLKDKRLYNQAKAIGRADQWARDHPDAMRRMDMIAGHEAEMRTLSKDFNQMVRDLQTDKANFASSRTAFERLQNQREQAMREFLRKTKDPNWNVDVVR